MLIENRHRHQFLNGRGRRRFLGFSSNRLDRLEDAGMFYSAKLLKISAFLLNAVWAATALLEIGIAPVVRRCSGKRNLSRPPSRRSSATSAYCTLNTFASTMLTSSGVTPSPSTDPRGS